MIFEHYRKLRIEAEDKVWFSVLPAECAKKKYATVGSVKIIIALLALAIPLLADHDFSDPNGENFWLDYDLEQAQRRQWQHEDNEAYWDSINRRIQSGYEQSERNREYLGLRPVW